MKNRISDTSKGEESEFNALKRAGLEFEPPQDEFSYQPDSGSSAGGRIGEQEYGIKSVYDTDTRDTKAGELQEGEDGEDPDSIVPGVSEWSLEHRLPEDERLITSSAAQDAGLVKNASGSNQELEETQIKIQSTIGQATETGLVESSDRKWRVDDFFREIPEVAAISNQLRDQVKPVK